MPEETVDHNLDNRLNKRKRLKVRLAFLGGALLLLLALGAPAVLNHLVPKVPTRAQGITARVAWYRHSGQMQADFRTAAAAFHFVTGTESETPTLNTYSNPPVAENAAPRSPKI